MRIALGADHGGVDLKAEIAAALREQGHAVEDLGAEGASSSSSLVLRLQHPKGLLVVGARRLLLVNVSPARQEASSSSALPRGASYARRGERGSPLFPPLSPSSATW